MNSSEAQSWADRYLTHRTIWSTACPNFIFSMCRATKLTAQLNVLNAGEFILPSVLLIHSQWYLNLLFGVECIRSSADVFSRLNLCSSGSQARLTWVTRAFQTISKYPLTWKNVWKKKQTSERLSFVKEADINLKIEAAVMYYLSAAVFVPYPFLWVMFSALFYLCCLWWWPKC